MQHEIGSKNDIVIDVNSFGPRYNDKGRAQQAGQTTHHQPRPFPALNGIG